MSTKRWLSLREAATLLGVHPATLRQWADRGIIPALRTPGGHRRFAREDIEAFLRQRLEGPSLVIPQHSQVWMHRALETARERLVEVRRDALWYRAFDEETRLRKRQEGRQLFALAMQYITKPEERPHILARARSLGYRYGEDSVRFQVPLADTLRAIFFFENALLDTLEASGDFENGQSPADLRVERGIQEFIREVLYAVVQGYEETLRRSLGPADLGARV